MLSLILAKIGIFNTILISNDLKNVVNDYSTNITIIDLMEVAQTKVLLDNNFLHFPSRTVRHVVLDSTIISLGKIGGLAPRKLFQGDSIRISYVRRSRTFQN